MSEKTLYVDYTFELGKYEDMNETIDTNNFKYKLNALMNIIHMRPGTVQDCPFIGIDTTGLQFSENDEVDEHITKVQNAIMQQASRYIEDGFVESVKITTEDQPGTLGVKQVSLAIKLKGNIGVLVESVNTPSGLVYKNLTLDTSQFVS